MRSRGNGSPVNGAGWGFTPGCWRADPPSGRVAIPEGPQAPIARTDAPTVNERDSRSRDPRTAANLAAKADALAPKRWRPTDG